MAFQLGQRAGQYEFIDIVDSNPNRVAFRVRNLTNNRFELLRVLGAAVQGDEERTNRFFREASVHARLVHPNIVGFYRATTLDGQFVIMTELAEGVTLAERLELGPLPLPLAVSFFDQILSALECAHQHGIVHRNVSPSSIIVTPDSSIKLAGFTYARGSIDPQLTQVGFTVGDVHYLSPEQVRGAAILDPRCDIYAAGIVLYESITGRKPFDGKSQFEVLAAQVSVVPPPPSQLQPSLTFGWDAVVMKALAKEPSERYQSAAEFLAALGSLVPSSSASAIVFEAVTAKAGNVVPRRWHASLTWAVLAIAAFTVFFFMSSHQ
jgi:serine/threonine-protein kinase